MHHGDGTQEILGRWPDVGIVDLHQHPLFPGTGAAEETGDGDVWNVPLSAGCEDADYAWLLGRILPPLARRIRPQLVLVSCGLDPHADDPLGGMQLTDRGFGVLAAAVRDDGDGKLTPVEITVGVRSGGSYEVISGLKEGDRVVTSANFLVDSESSMQAALKAVAGE